MDASRCRSHEPGEASISPAATPKNTVLWNVSRPFEPNCFVPYPPPPGYKFVVTGVTSNTSYAVGAAGSQDGSTWQLRLIQFAAAALVELRVSWQLVKDI